MTTPNNETKVSNRLNCHLTANSFVGVQQIILEFDIAESSKVTILPKGIMFNAAQGSNRLEFNIKRTIMSDIIANGAPVMSNVLNPQIFISQRTFSMESEHPMLNPVVTIKYSDGHTLTGDDAAHMVDEITVIDDVCIDVAWHDGQSSVEITPIRPGQLSVYFKAQGRILDNMAELHSLTLQHDDQGYCNVYHDVTINGTWERERRKKLGSFQYELRKEYSVSLALMPESKIGIYIHMPHHCDSVHYHTTSDVPYANAIEHLVVKSTYRSGVFKVYDPVSVALDAIKDAETDQNPANYDPSHHDQDAAADATAPIQ